MSIETAPAVPVYCDFIKQSGSSAIIDTGVKIPSLGSIYVQAYATANFSQRAIVGADDGNGGSTTIRIKTSGGTRTWYCNYDGGATANRNGGALNSRLYCGLTPYRFFGSMSATTLTKGSTAPDENVKIFSFGNYSGGATLYIGPVYIYGSDAKDETTIQALATHTPVATFLPCTYRGAAGFWHVEEDRFIGNSGTGTLSAINI